MSLILGFGVLFGWQALVLDQYLKKGDRAVAEVIGVESGSMKRYWYTLRIDGSFYHADSLMKFGQGERLDVTIFAGQVVLVDKNQLALVAFWNYMNSELGIYFQVFLAVFLFLVGWEFFDFIERRRRKR